MIRTVALVLFLTLLDIQNLAAEEELEAPRLRAFEAEYVIKKAGVTVGTLSRKLTINNNSHYEFSSVAMPSGLAALFSSNETAETSTGTFSDSKIRPRRYDYERKKGDKLKVDQVNFDLANKTLNVNRRGVSSQRLLAEGSLDKLSYQLQLMLDLLNDRTTLSYTVETATKTKTYDANKTVNEETVTPTGKYLTIRIDESSSTDKRTSFWCSEDLGFLPVKVAVTEDGDVTEILLSNFQYLP